MIALLAPLLILAADPPSIDTIPVRRVPVVGQATANVFISPSGEPFRAPLDQPYPIGVWFARVDADHDGAITPAEFDADAKAFFDRLDADHDGIIDGFEIADYENKVAPEIQPSLGGFAENESPPTRASEATPHVTPASSKKSKKPPAKGAAVFDLLLDPEPVASADTDLDGKVSLKEAMTAAGRRFKRLDTNHDGRLTLEELPQTPAQALKRRE
jgi:hypothetical protein